MWLGRIKNRYCMGSNGEGLFELIKDIFKIFSIYFIAEELPYLSVKMAITIFFSKRESQGLQSWMRLRTCHEWSQGLNPDLFDFRDQSLHQYFSQFKLFSK